MPRLRVHNLNISLDGYAAGTYVSFDAPIGDAQGLFASFDGRFIHGVGPVDAPVTLDRALTTLWGQGIGAEIMGRGKFGPAGRGVARGRAGAGGGATSRPS